MAPEKSGGLAVVWRLQADPRAEGIFAALDGIAYDSKEARAAVRLQHIPEPRDGLAVGIGFAAFAPEGDRVRILHRVPFDAIARFTQWLNVRDLVRAALTDRNYVVNRQHDVNLSATTRDTAEAVDSLQAVPFDGGEPFSGREPWVRPACVSVVFSLRRALAAGTADAVPDNPKESIWFPGSATFTSLAWDQARRVH